VDTNNIDKNLINAICRNLEDESIELLDFDSLKKLLIDMQHACESQNQIAAELHLIKEEYRNRIIGMLKANMACKPEEDDARMIADLSGDLSDLEAGRLVKLYSRNAARFRSNFPASFGYMTYTGKRYPARNWKDHKI